ncbi:MAG: twin-arginine translocase subunit TatC [Actinomycetia bacterium]|nr:twin-arginine translocase subunit TatC [Actinomycetes bacterium]
MSLRDFDPPREGRALGYTCTMSGDSTKTMPLTGHLGELRRRLLYVAIVLVVCVIGCFVAKDYVLAVVLYPLKSTHIRELTTLGVTESFMNVLKVSIYAGLIVSLPFILYEFWAFIMPGLYENERRSVVPYVASTTFLFLAGVVFAYFIVLPVGLRFMLGFGGEYFGQLLQAEKYISFVTLFLLAFGVVFELPMVMMLLAWSGLVDHMKMRKVRKYAILVEAVIAMVFTPSQDPVSMALMLIPLIILYEVGIVLAKIVGKRKARRAESAALADAKAAGFSDPEGANG